VSVEPNERGLLSITSPSRLGVELLPPGRLVVKNKLREPINTLRKTLKYTSNVYNYGNEWFLKLSS
jgi:hypothetical protein